MSRHNLEKITLANNNYRKVIRTDPNMQLVLMCLDPGVEIGTESHHNATQFFRIEAGVAHAKVGDKKYILKDGDSLIVPAGTTHNIWCSKKASESAKMYTIYSSPQHSDQAIHKEKCLESPSRIFRVPRKSTK